MKVRVNDTEVGLGKIHSMKGDEALEYKGA